MKHTTANDRLASEKLVSIFPAGSVSTALQKIL
jgi:hypothetical protein